MRIPSIPRRQGVAAAFGVALLLVGGLAFAAQVSGEHPDPVADAGPDQRVECASPEGATVRLDASRSSVGGNDTVRGPAWYANGTDGARRLLGEGETINVTLPLGRHEVELVVTLDREVHAENATSPNGTVSNATAWGSDANGTTSDDTGSNGTASNGTATDADETVSPADATTTRREKLRDRVVVEVVDTTAPNLVGSVSPASLWPPNHKLVPVEVDLRVDDACGATSWSLVGAASDEAEDGRGDGRTAPDLLGVEIGAQDTSFLLRAERAGPGDGRAYTLTYEAVDASGNVARRDVVVAVPHDQGR